MRVTSSINLKPMTGDSGCEGIWSCFQVHVKEEAVMGRFILQVVYNQIDFEAGLAFDILENF